MSEGVAETVTISPCPISQGSDVQYTHGACWDIDSAEHQYGVTSVVAMETSFGHIAA